MAADGILGDSDLNDPDLHKIARWVAEIDLYNTETHSWLERSKKIIARYKDDRKSPQEDVRRKFNVLWSNVQTLLPALYARNPKPDIQRRFRDADPIGRVSSIILERSVTYFCDTDNFAAMCRACVLDYLLPGRGTIWVRYEPTIESAEVEITDDAEEGESTPQGETIAFEEVKTDYVHHTDFGYNICRMWEEVWCVWRKVFMTRREMVRRFGKKKGNLAPLDHEAKDLSGKTLADGVRKSTIYELWDKERECAVWFHKDIPEALDLRDDPLKLEEFFPCPKPLLVNLANDSLIPVPDYVEYQDQAQELDQLTGRIASIQKCLKVAGIYDASAPGIERLLSEGVENQLIPVQSWATIVDKGGLKGAMDLLPLADIASALAELYGVRAQVKTDLYEVTGIADLVRGNSDPNETATAQQIKSNFATMRIGDRQREVQRFVRNIVRLMVDIICNHFQMETIKKISGVRLFTTQEKEAARQAAALGQPPLIPPGVSQDQFEIMLNDPTWEEVEGLIRDKALRCFRIDIETDSTIKADEEQEKASRIEFLKASGAFLQQALEVGQGQPALIPLICEMLMFGVRAFPIGKELESAFSSAVTKLEKIAANPSPQPDPEMAKVQSQSQLQQMKQQADAQNEQAKLMSGAKIEQMRMASELQIAHAKMEMEAAVDQHRNELEAQREQLRMANEQRLNEMKLAMQERVEIERAHIQAAASIEVARIGAGADMGIAAEEREAAAEGLDQGKTEATEVAAEPTDMNKEQFDGIMDAISQMSKHHGDAVKTLADAHRRSQSDHQATTQAMLKAMTAEKELVRDPKTGKALGVRHKRSPEDMAKALEPAE